MFVCVAAMSMSFDGSTLAASQHPKRRLQFVQGLFGAAGLAVEQHAI